MRPQYVGVVSCLRWPERGTRTFRRDGRGSSHPNWWFFSVQSGSLPPVAVVLSTRSGFGRSVRSSGPRRNAWVRVAATNAREGRLRKTAKGLYRPRQDTTRHDETRHDETRHDRTDAARFGWPLRHDDAGRRQAATEDDRTRRAPAFHAKVAARNLSMHSDAAGCGSDMKPPLGAQAAPPSGPSRPVGSAIGESRWQS